MLYFDRILEVADPAVALPIAVARGLRALGAADFLGTRRRFWHLWFRLIRRRLGGWFLGVFAHVRKLSAVSGSGQVSAESEGSPCHQPRVTGRRFGYNHPHERTSHSTDDLPTRHRARPPRPRPRAEAAAGGGVRAASRPG